MSGAAPPQAPALLAGLVDDAAVFPPGLAPLDVAVDEHLARRAHPYAACVGPLLVPATSAGELARIAAKDERASAEPLPVGLVVRPDSPMEPLFDAVDLLGDEPRVRLTGGELGWNPSWRQALGLGLPLVVEVRLGGEQRQGLEEIGAAVDEGAAVIAKFRTGPTPAWAWPDEATLAAFLSEAIERGLAFKLTGGLHHAIRGEYKGKPMHGLVNVLLATHEALDGAKATQLAGVLRQTRSELLVEHLATLDAEQVVRLRSSFTSYGCCGVLEPINELAALGLIH
ncbi:MAG: hypothetical protein L0H79_05560 [Intrasporangium sp.]|uniref:hypothetical protein n=1 Tax=Intrasporangium sp. TaxID=1925024 RepID=UPI0026476BEF|nr:hypothetical protein [Intrasporangium sp.]MDN5795204.1 hypothetical protein [Intrasporangium sp.]